MASKVITRRRQATNTQSSGMGQVARKPDERGARELGRKESDPRGSNSRGLTKRDFMDYNDSDVQTTMTLDSE